jgi:hydroxyacylglutathione hydrolase
MTVEPVRAFADNYIWMILNDAGSHCAIVDPGDAAPVIQWLEREGVEPVALLITHHHGDHVGGIRGLLSGFPHLEVYGPASERIPGMTQPLGEGDTVRLDSLSVEFQVLDVPGHTAGHIAYLGEGALFCGDTLFAGGCGRVFDGTFQQLCDSLKKIRALPGDTLVYCAHEYTLDNLGFAKWVEPANQDLLARDDEDMALQERGIPTVPSRLSLEKATNPFLRFDHPAVIQRAEEQAGRPLADACSVFTVLRQWKDSEYD